MKSVGPYFGFHNIVIKKSILNIFLKVGEQQPEKV